LRGGGGYIVLEIELCNAEIKAKEFDLSISFLKTNNKKSNGKNKLLNI
jgi:hypothetical protein